jgi:hypothetical protein
MRCTATMGSSRGRSLSHCSGNHYKLNSFNHWTKLLIEVTDHNGF